MNFRKHLELEGRHAPFSASQSSWLRYNDDKAVDTYLNLRAKEMGTIIHEWAAQTINLLAINLGSSPAAIIFAR